MFSTTSAWSLRLCISVAGTLTNPRRSCGSQPLNTHPSVVSFDRDHSSKCTYPRISLGHARPIGCQWVLSSVNFTGTVRGLGFSRVSWDTAPPKVAVERNRTTRQVRKQKLNDSMYCNLTSRKVRAKDHHPPSSIHPHGRTGRTKWRDNLEAGSRCHVPWDIKS